MARNICIAQIFRERGNGAGRGDARPQRVQARLDGLQVPAVYILFGGCGARAAVPKVTLVWGGCVQSLLVLLNPTFFLVLQPSSLQLNRNCLGRLGWGGAGGRRQRLIPGAGRRAATARDSSETAALVTNSCFGTQRRSRQVSDSSFPRLGASPAAPSRPVQLP